MRANNPQRALIFIEAAYNLNEEHPQVVLNYVNSLLANDRLLRARIILEKKFKLSNDLNKLYEKHRS